MKKILSLGLCVVLLISSLTACRTERPEQPSNTPEPSISTPAEPTPEITPDTTQEPEIQPSEPVNIEPTESIDETESQNIIENDENGNIEATPETESAPATTPKQEPKSNNQINTGSSSTGNGNININDDISAEEYAEIERQMWELFEQNGGTYTDSGREGQISDSEEEYIGTHLNGGGGQLSSSGTSYGDDLTPEQAAEARRKAEEAFLNSGGVIITDQTDGTQIDEETREYIGTILNGGGIQYDP